MTSKLSMLIFRFCIASNPSASFAESSPCSSGVLVRQPVEQPSIECESDRNRDDGEAPRAHVQEHERDGVKDEQARGREIVQSTGVNTLWHER